MVLFPSVSVGTDSKPRYALVLARCFDVRSESAKVDERPWRRDGSRPSELSVGRRSLRSTPIDARLVCW